MPKEKIDLMIEGGKASAGAVLGQKLGPLKINIANVLKQINDKTASFNGMKVPVKLIVDTETKDFEIEIGLPPVSELIKSELKLEKGSGIPDKYKVSNIAIEQVIKIANIKKESMYTNSLKSAVKSVIGSCNSLGVLIESKTAPEIIKEIISGKYDNEINNIKTEPSEEKLAQLQLDLAVKQAEGKKYIEQMEAEKAAKVAAAEARAAGIAPLAGAQAPAAAPAPGKTPASTSKTQSAAPATAPGKTPAQPGKAQPQTAKKQQEAKKK